VSEAVGVLRTLVAAPVTRTVRGIPTEIPLGADEGLPVEGAATMAGLLAIPKAMLVRRIGALARARRHELCASLGAMADC
jgi:mRNA interferase MazF